MPKETYYAFDREGNVVNSCQCRTLDQAVQRMGYDHDIGSGDVDELRETFRQMNALD